MLSPSRVVIARLRQWRLAGRAWRGALGGGPCIRRLVLMLHNRCAMRCRMCDLWLEPETVFPAGRIPALLRSRCLDRGRLAVYLTGGEPFLYPDFAGVYRSIRGQLPEAEIGIQSSGWPAQAVVDFLRASPDLRHTTLSFSFDGVGAHDSLRGRPGAESELLGLLEAARRLAPGVRVVLQSTITPWNAGAVKETSAKARELGLAIQFLLVHDQPEYTNSVRRPQDGLAFPWPSEAWARLPLRDRQELGHLLRLIERVESGGGDGSLPCCPVPAQSAFVRADGAVLTCRSRPPVGNVLKEGLDAALGSEAAEQLRRTGCGACEPRFSAF